MEKDIIGQVGIKVDDKYQLWTRTNMTRDILSTGKKVIK